MWTVGKYKANLQLGYGSVKNSTLGSIGPTRLSNAAAIFGLVIITVLAIFLISALVAPVANLTTGITIAHTGFTPNSNVTGTPGLAPILQLYPLFFVFIGLIYAAKVFSEESRGI
jgi:hypothetical protein